MHQGSGRGGREVGAIKGGKIVDREKLSRCLTFLVKILSDFTELPIA